MGNEFQYQMLDRMRLDCEYFWDMETDAQKIYGVKVWISTLKQ